MWMSDKGVGLGQGSKLTWDYGKHQGWGEILKSFASDLTLNYNVIPPSDRQFMSSSVETGNVREMLVGISQIHLDNLVH